MEKAQITTVPCVFVCLFSFIICLFLLFSLFPKKKQINSFRWLAQDVVSVNIWTQYLTLFSIFTHVKIIKILNFTKILPVFTSKPVISHLFLFAFIWNLCTFSMEKMLCLYIQIEEKEWHLIPKHNSRP